jgi:hypothetical protein
LSCHFRGKVICARKNPSGDEILRARVIELRKWRRAKAVAAESEGSEVTSSLDESAANSGDRLSKEGRAAIGDDGRTRIGAAKNGTGSPVVPTDLR